MLRLSDAIVYRPAHALLVPLALLLAAPAFSADTTALDAEARDIARELGARLKGRLEQAIAAGGPVAAIAVCREQATPVTEALAAEKGWSVGRTSLRIRNAANAPDAWETATLQDFQRRLAAGEPVASLEHSEIHTADARRFRYMKAIPVAETCTLCHGAAVAAPVEAAIRTHYPDDRATGYRAGEIRGAFTLEKRLE